MSLSQPGTANKYHHMLAGMSGGLASTMILHPIDVLKTRYQVYDGRGSAYSSLVEAVRTVYKREGVRGFFLGLTPACIASTVSWGGYFYFYEHCKNRRINALIDKRTTDGSSDSDSASERVQLGSVDHLLSGVEAGCYMVLVTNPLWLIKTRLQLQSEGQALGWNAQAAVAATPGTGPTGAGGGGGVVVQQRNYTGFIDAARSIVRHEGGIRGLYRGVVPALFLTSHGAVQFMAYEWLKKEAERLGWATRRPSNQNGGLAATASSASTVLDMPPHLTMVVGVASKVAATVLTYPYQVIKSRLQLRDMLMAVTDTAAGGSTTSAAAATTGAATSQQAQQQFVLRSKYTGVIDCVTQTVRHEGLRGFYKGFVANCLKVAPTAAITFVVYEQVVKML